MRWCRFVWGRGAIDVKFGVTALLEAVSQLLARGCAPSIARTSLLSGPACRKMQLLSSMLSLPKACS